MARRCLIIDRSQGMIDPCLRPISFERKAFDRVSKRLFSAAKQNYGSRNCFSAPQSKITGQKTAFLRRKAKSRVRKLLFCAEKQNHGSENCFSAPQSRITGQETAGACLKMTVHSPMKMVCEAAMRPPRVALGAWLFAKHLQSVVNRGQA